MAAKEKITRYYLIIRLLSRQPSTYGEIERYLEKEFFSRGYEVKISPRTFSRDKKEIEELFGIYIEYNASEKVYKLAKGVEPEVDDRIIEAFDYIDTFSGYKNITQYVYFEKRKASGTENLHGIIHAIKNRLVIKFNYQKYSDSTPSNRTVEPYVLKEFRYRWYIVGKDKKDHKIKIFALDRLSMLQFTDSVFDYPPNFSVHDYFKNSFGVVVEPDKEPEEVILSFDSFQGKYIKSLPLHPSQEIIEDNEEEVRIRLKLNITFDFVFEILSRGQYVKVIKPQSLIDELKKHYSNALRQYE